MTSKFSLNHQQSKAIKIENTNALVLAGAGSGKTLTIIERVSYLLDRGVNPKRILVLTFTRRAAQELIDRLRTRHSHLDSMVLAGTFHRFCLSSIRSHPHFFQRHVKAIVIDRGDQVSLMKLCRKEVLEHHEPSTFDGELDIPKTSALVELLSYIRSTDTSVFSYLTKFYKDNTQQENQAINDIFNQYKSKKENQRYLDFDDILIDFANRVAKDKELAQIFKKAYDHVLVDEIQDTNVIQWRILENLVNPAWLYCVGDDAQSIYSFRGANLANLQEFTRRVKNSEKLKLTINYRSTQSILSLANYILAQSSWDYDKELTAVHPLGEKPKLIDFQNATQEAEWIVGDIKGKLANNAKIKDFMVLTRTAWSVRTLEAILVEKKVPYKFVGGTSLLNSAHVKDLLALCRAAINPNDELSWVRWLSIFPGIGPKKALLASQAVRKAEDDTDKILAYFDKAFKQYPLIGTCLKLVWAYQKDPADMLDKIIILLEPEVSKLYDNWHARKNDWKLIATLATRHDSITSFIEAYTLDPVTSSAASLSDNENKNALTLITIHSAKGLEAKVCYIIQSQEGSFPHSRSTTKEEIEEERRVLYVAITRAKEELIITRASNFHGESFSQREYFLAKLAKKDELVDYQNKINLFCKDYFRNFRYR
ncbi:MAG: ATP-dependent helicase [SAR324 cluster bacterium]|nr:ATP-dependent helicase [SAR324 cluster bacterium]